MLTLTELEPIPTTPYFIFIKYPKWKMDFIFAISYTDDNFI